MSIISGFQKAKNYIKGSDGVKLLSRWTHADTVEVDDKGTTLSSKISTMDSAISGKIDSSTKGAVNGVVPLNEHGLIDARFIPGQLDDVLEGTANNITTLDTGSKTAESFTLVGESKPCIPESGKIYIDINTSAQFRWSGTIFVSTGSSLALGETSSTAYAGDKGKANADAIVNLENNKMPLKPDNITLSAEKSYISELTKEHLHVGHLNNNAYSEMTMGEVKTFNSGNYSSITPTSITEGNVALSSKYVPQTRTVNGKALSNNISLTATDVGALPSTTNIPTVTDTYSATSSSAMSGKAVASAISSKGTYSKPSGGIPKTDLASTVQTSLGKADSALQSVPTASSSVLGGVKVGSNMKIKDGVLSQKEVEITQANYNKLKAGTAVSGYDAWDANTTYFIRDADDFNADNISYSGTVDSSTVKGAIDMLNSNFVNLLKSQRLNGTTLANGTIVIDDLTSSNTIVCCRSTNNDTNYALYIPYFNHTDKKWYIKVINVVDITTLSNKLIDVVVYYI